MAISATPSRVTTPPADTHYPSILDFLTARFPQVDSSLWRQRIHAGKVRDARHAPITLNTEYLPNTLLYYFREVEQERIIPFSERILFRNEHLLVACKPHFLPVTPGGGYVNECLLNRLRLTTANNELMPLHRIDRETAGIVIFSVNPATRGLYSRLFATGAINKTYQALAEPGGDLSRAEWTVANRIVKGDPWFRMKTVPGEPNAHSRIRLVSVEDGKARFDLSPVTGKTHQLRIHLSGIGFKIINDRYYPDLQPEQEDDFDTPLQLIAKSVKFLDPVMGEHMEFSSERELLKQQDQRQ